ncbi:MAG: tripartite tricarboxylate transporter substrate binding protein [Burkholderiaceae bacterium]
MEVAQRSNDESQSPATRRDFLLTAGTGSLLAALGLAGPAGAQNWPAKPVRFIVPFPPGGPVDTVARATAHRLSELWGQQTIVDNRAGAGGILGAEIAAKAPADGYTVFVCSIHHSVIPSLKPRIGYDIRKDFVPLSFGARFPIVLVAHPSLPAKNIAELIALAKKEPDKLAFASAGNGGGTHLAGELFNMMAGIKLLHVPYKGSAPAMTDVLANQVPLMFADGPTALPQVKAGKVKALGVGNSQRSELFPDVPTIAEQGLPEYDAYSWAAFVAPAGTPPPIVSRLSADIGRALADPEVKRRLYEAGAEAAPTTAESFGRMLAEELEKWSKVVRTANIQAD